MIAFLRNVYSPVRLACAGALTLVTVLSTISTGSPPIAPPSYPLPNHIGGVHGYVWVQCPPSPLAAPGELDRVALPDLDLELRDKVSGTLVATTSSNVYGRYYFPPQPLGTYELLWPAQDGWKAGSYSQDIIIKQGTVYPEALLVSPIPGNSAILGEVRFADGSIPGMIDEYFGLEETADVTVSNNAGLVLAGPVRSNSNGNFAVSTKLLSSGMRLNAKLEGVSVTKKFFGASGPASSLRKTFVGGKIFQRLTLPNTAPQIISMYLEDALGNAVREGSSGELLTTQSQVVDTDGDSVQIQWRSEFPSGAAALTPSGNQVTWQLPNNSAGHNLYAMVSDGRGGYARSSVGASVNKTFETFSGVTIDSSSQDPVVGATIEVNGLETVSQAGGFWSLQVPVQDSYLMNIRQRDYALAGRRFDRGSQGVTWELVPRMSVQFDPTQPFTLTDDRPELRQEGRRGATITLPADSLVDPQGQLPTGPLRASFATLNIGDAQSAGDYAGITSAGTTGLISYGVVSIEITDALGQEYQIRQGMKAELSVPIAGVEVGEIPNGAPDTVPVWSYDEKDGLWRESGMADLNQADSTYVGTVNHFSEINIDAPGLDTSIRVLVDPSLIGFTLRIQDVPGDGLDYAASEEMVLDDPLNCIYTVPPGQKVLLDVLDTDGVTVLSDVEIQRFDAGIPSAGWISLPDHEVQSGPVIATTFPAYPYSECPITVTLKWKGASAPFFLHNKGIGSSVVAQEYYDIINPQVGGIGNRDTLQDWWAHNGFNTDGSVTTTGSETYARTSYLNDNDLGSGRDMHLYGREDGTSMAWVSNYGAFDQNHGNADLALAQTSPGATVCMEFSPMENAAGTYVDASGAEILPGDFGSTAAYHAAVQAASVTKFLVFADIDAAPGAELQTAADLDGYGPKFIPNLCMNCHGGSPSGSYTTPADGQINSFFRELDYDTYKFAAGALVPSAAEQAAFRVQNDIVRGSGSSLISGAAIKELIDIWYQGGPGDVVQDDCVVVGGVLDPTTLPVGWGSAPTAYQDFYCDVVAESCRTCHIAFGGLSFNSSTGFGDGSYIEGRLGDFVNNTPATGTMPHALVTYRNFWLSEAPFRPDATNVFTSNN